MAWNEPGGDKDPWGGRGGDQGPPDLDEALKKLTGQLSGIFGSGGGKRVALEYSLRFLGNVPMDPKVVLGGDSGKPYLSSGVGTVATKAFDQVLDNVIKDLPIKKES